MKEVLFYLEDGLYVPTELSGGPWHDSTLHGGAPAGLFAHCFEKHLGENDLQPARLTMDLMRPVPRAPLKIKVETLRQGKRIALLEAQLSCQDKLLAKATALFVKPNSVSLPEYAPLRSFDAPQVESLQEKSFNEILFQKAEGTPTGLHTTVRMRPISELQEHGQGQAWMALPVPVVEGFDNSPFVLAATLSDFGNGVGQLCLGPGVGTINADVHLQLSRLPVGEWIGLDSSTYMEGHGIGQANTLLFDEQGPFGQVTQVVMPI